MPSNYFENFGITTVTDATITLTAAAHLGSRVVLNRDAGVTVTLPASSGSGNRYEFFLAVDATGSQIIKVANATDVMMGVAYLGNDAAGASCFYTADASDTITLNGTTTGGYKGAKVVVDDIASGKWAVFVYSEASGIEATPFSAGA